MGTTPPDKRHPEEPLFRRFCEDQRAAARRVYEQCFPVVEKLVRREGGSSEEAKDIFQGVLLAMLNYCRKIDFRLTAPLSGLAYGIGKKLWLKKMKKKIDSKITFYDESEYVDMEHLFKLQADEALSAHRLQLIRKHMSSLTPKEQLVLNLYYMEQKSHREIAEIVPFKNEESARVQKFRYLKKLTELVMNDPDFE